MKDLLKGLCIGFGIGLTLILIYVLYLFFVRPGDSSDPTDPPAQTEETRQESEADPVTDSEPEDIGSETPEAPVADIPGLEEETSDSGEEPPEEETPAGSSDATLAFAGDVLFSEQYLSAYDRGGISAIADSEMLSHMQEADLFILNEEFPFSTQGEAMEEKQYTFRIDPKYVSIFRELGTDIVTVANNHALDFGQAAFCDTLDTLRQADITCIGGGYNIAEASAPAIVTAQDQTFAVFGATRVSPSYSWYATDSQPGLFQTYDPSKLNAAIAEMSQTVDHVIVFVHWGVERSETPEEYQRTLAQGYIDAGADLIVGCHPHVLQGFEYYNGVPIVYSLGNYLFGNRDGETLLLQAIFSKENGLTLQLIPCKRQNGVLARIQEPSALYQKLTDLSFGVNISEDGTLAP